jgi:hypothetical protein
MIVEKTRTLTRPLKSKPFLACGKKQVAGGNKEVGEKTSVVSQNIMPPQKKSNKADIKKKDIAVGCREQDKRVREDAISLALDNLAEIVHTLIL